MEYTIYDSDLIHRINPWKYIDTKLVKAGFDLDKPMESKRDYKKLCVIYRQEDKHYGMQDI
jgi:hypothetical protein